MSSQKIGGCVLHKMTSRVNYNLNKSEIFQITYSIIIQEFKSQIT